MFDTSIEGLRKIIAAGENSSVEFKLRFGAENSIARHLSAFANSGGGIMIFGVADDKNVVGFSGEEEKSQTHARLSRLARKLLPQSNFVTGRAEINGREVIFIVVDEVPASVKPIRIATGDALTLSDGVVVELASAQPTILSASKRFKIFVAMSFRTEEEPALVDYYQAMERAKKATGLPIDLVRIDLVEGDYEISQRIMDEIDKADAVLADFTLSPANVYFEIGYARGRKRRVIQTARKGTTLEFDARNWRTIFYKNATELEKALEKALMEAYAVFNSAEIQETETTPASS